jgi:hypothetical protein
MDSPLAAASDPLFAIVQGLLSVAVYRSLSEGLVRHVELRSLRHSGVMAEHLGVHGLAAIPGVDPGGILYGVLSVATVIAAEGTRQETFAKLVAASIVTMVVYWIAHAYGRHWALRLHKAPDWSLKEIAVSLRFESSILMGAILPIAVLVITWIAGLGLETAVTAVLWTAAVEIVTLEVVPALRHHLRPKDLLVQTAVGVILGIGILALRLLLH